MMLFAVLSAALAASVSASLIIKTPLTRLERTGSYLKGAPQADRARAAFLKNSAVSGPTDAPASNLAYVLYTTRVGIGSPPTYYNLLVDTGSSNTFCGTNIPYVQTSTTIPTGETVAAFYGTGFFVGLEFLDQVTLAPNLVITDQSIGDALVYEAFPGIDGVLGVGPVGLTLGTLSPDSQFTIPTVMNNLVTQGLIANQVLGVYFAPATSPNDTNGALTYGGADPSLYEGDLSYTPLTQTFPAANYWGINITSATYGLNTIITFSTAGIVDTGTTLLVLADDFFTEYMNAIPGAFLDTAVTGLIDIPVDSVPSMQPLIFQIGCRTFTMDVAAQLIPRDQNDAWGGIPERQYGIVGHLGAKSGQGLDFILGMKFLERYYSVYDTDNSRVGFANTRNTFSPIQE